MIAPKEIIRPGRALIKSPIPRTNVSFLQSSFFSEGFQSVICPHVDTLLFPREYLAPPFRGSSALAVKKKFGTLGLRTKKGHLRKSAIPASPAARGQKFYKIFSLCDRRLALVSVDPREKPMGGSMKGGSRKEYEMMHPAHRAKTDLFSWRGRQLVRDAGIKTISGIPLE